MPKLQEKLLETLQALKGEEFKTFKWHLKHDDALQGFSGIQEAKLEKAEREDTVDLMVQTYQDHGALKRTMQVLEQLRRNDLKQRLHNYTSPQQRVKHLSLVIFLFGLLVFIGFSSNCTNELKKVPQKPNKHDLGGQTEDHERKKAELKRVQQFAVEVTLDPDTAHPNLVLSYDKKQVHFGNVRKKLPDFPGRFNYCVSILGKQSLSSGKHYFEVQVKEKTAWTVGVAKESIGRKGQITTSPEQGLWTVRLRNGDTYEANENPPKPLSPRSPPQKVGVFVDYEEGMVSFFDVDTEDLLHSFTGCSFHEKLFPYFHPYLNDGGKNSAPLIISPVKNPQKPNKHDFGGQTEDHERKKAELKHVQQFAVEVTLDPDTAHPNLVLSYDKKQVHHGNVRKQLPDYPGRFNYIVSVLGKQSFSSGKHYFEVQVKGKTAWTVGVAEESIGRKGQITAIPEGGFWTVRLRNGDRYEANENLPLPLSLRSPPKKVGVFVNYKEGMVSFYDVDTADLLHSFTGCSFNKKLFPYFHPYLNDDGKNSAPLIISPVYHEYTADLLHSFTDLSFNEKLFPYFHPYLNHGGRNSAPLIISPFNNPLKPNKHDLGGQTEDHERKKAELKRVQQFAVEVTLDPDTAHPNLVLSDDGKQVHHGKEKKKLPDNPWRFNYCVSILGKQSFSSGKHYFEVQVKGKTAWDIGVAEESIGRKGQITLIPEGGFWTVWLRNGYRYEANENPLKPLPLRSPPQKVGVFVDYEKGMVSFFDVDTADLLHSFTGCSFHEKLFPYFSPHLNDGGRNSAPLIISPVNIPLKPNKHDHGGQTEDHETKKAELKSVQQFAVEVTLDPDTAHPNLVLSDDGKQVYDVDVRKKLPDYPGRFNYCVSILGKQSISSGKHYYEAHVKGKTAWTVGVAKESIARKGKIIARPEGGFWTVSLRNGGRYKANENLPLPLTLKSPPQKVGVFVDYEEGMVSFYDVDTADLLHSFTGLAFNEKLFPYFSPCVNNGGKNSAPLIISSVDNPQKPNQHDHGGQTEDHERKKAELKHVQQFAVEVTLDPDTAHPNLILSHDKKQVYDVDVRKKLLDNPGRFNYCVSILGKQSFSSGKHYFEVQVTGKTAWDIGVAKESIGRKGEIKLFPEGGFWTVWLRDGDRFQANENPPKPLSLRSPPQKVGVFVDYEEGMVSFYDVDTADLLHSFTGFSFNEKLFPYFSPDLNDGGRNSAPLIISPVNNPLKPNKHDHGGQTEDHERKKAEL